MAKQKTCSVIETKELNELHVEYMQHKNKGETFQEFVESTSDDGIPLTKKLNCSILRRK